MVCELVDIATLNLGVRAECFQGEGALSGNLRRHLIVRRSANIDVFLKRTLNSDGNGFESLKEWKVTGGGENNIMKKQQEAGLLFWICPFDEWFKLYL
jgi:hypothetical protein